MDLHQLHKPFCIQHRRFNAMIEDAQWEDIPPMSTERWLFGMLPLLGRLYAIGGYDLDSNRQSSVECYDPSTNHWTACAPMIEPRADLSSASFDGRIYVADVNSFERFDPADNSWALVSHANSGCHRSAA